MNVYDDFDFDNMFQWIPLIINSYRLVVMNCGFATGMIGFLLIKPFLLAYFGMFVLSLHMLCV